MSTTLGRITPFNGLCKYCLNLTKVQEYTSDTFEQEGIKTYQCSAIPGLTFDSIIETIIDGDSLTLALADTNISNCNRFLPGAKLLFTSIVYDSTMGAETLTIGYNLQGVVGTPDLNFYFVGTSTPIGTASAVTDGSNTIVINGALADGDYYLYMQLSTTEMSVIYPFNIVTT